MASAEEMMAMLDDAIVKVDQLQAENARLRRTFRQRLLTAISEVHCGNREEAEQIAEVAIQEILRAITGESP